MHTQLCAEQREGIGKRLHKEVEILENEQNAHVEHYRPHVNPFAPRCIFGSAYPPSGEEGR